MPPRPPCDGLREGRRVSLAGADAGRAHRYYDDEMTVSFLFGGFGAVTAGGGAVALTQSGDFAHGFGFSSLIAGGLTVLGATPTIFLNARLKAAYEP